MTSGIELDWVNLDKKRYFRFFLGEGDLKFYICITFCKFSAQLVMPSENGCSIGETDSIFLQI